MLYGHDYQLEKVLSLNYMDTQQLHHLALGSGTATWQPLFSMILRAEMYTFIHSEFTYTSKLTLSKTPAYVYMAKLAS